MKKGISIIVTILVLVGIAILFAVRWNAWFAMPAEPQWNGEIIDYHFYCFGEDFVPGFVKTNVKVPYWQDTLIPDTLQIILFGDIHNSLTHEQLDAISLRHPNVDCYAQLGDFFERLYPYYIQRNYDALKDTRFESLPVLATPGNHEYIKGIRPRISPLWFTLFCNPLNGPIGMPPSTYYVDFAHLRFIAIDTNNLFWLREYTRINTWVKAAIDGAGDRFVVVMMHHPIHASARGRTNILKAAALFRAIEGADIVFSGHDHTYSRKMPFINTNSSNKFYSLSKKTKAESDSLWKAQSHPLYELITVTSSSLQLETRRIDDGTLVDVWQ